MNSSVKISLRDVFGVSTDVPKYTYVDRQALDRKFEHYLQSQKHIVVHGASKQGKSCLRKKNIDANNCIIVQCLPRMISSDNIWQAALQLLGHAEVSRVSTTNSSSNEASATGSVQTSIPFLGSVTGEMNGNISSEEENETELTPVGENHLSALARILRERNKRLVLEDFHYLPEEVRKESAFGMKALYEEGAYVVVVGIWSEQNLITYYNGDLTGRIEEINLTWDESELEKVLSQGEGALNIEFAPGLKRQLVESSFQNVGLLQRLAEKICMEANIYETQDEKIVISDIELLKKARAAIVTDIRQRYLRITDVFVEGMRADSVLHLYARIYNELIDATDDELINGIGLTPLLERIQSNAASDLIIRQSDLTQCLERIERLQANRSITPLLVSFSKSLRKLFLNDREFLFYRKYSGDNPHDLKVDFESAE